MYNEMVVLKMLQSMTKLMASPPEVFCEEAIGHFKLCGSDMYDRIKKWMDTSNKYNNSNKKDSSE
jgi:ubiquitin-conjugating enzyme E2 O